MLITTGAQRVNPREWIQDLTFLADEEEALNFLTSISRKPTTSVATWQKITQVQVLVD